MLRPYVVVAAGFAGNHHLDRFHHAAAHVRLVGWLVSLPNQSLPNQSQPNQSAVEAGYGEAKHAPPRNSYH